MGIDEQRRGHKTPRQSIRRTVFVLALIATAIYLVFVFSGILHTAQP